MKKIIRFLEKLDKAVSFISKLGAFTGALIVLLTTVMIFAYVINRAFIGQVWLFVEEWTALALIPMAYLGMAYTLRRNKHIRVDILVERFSPKVQRILEIFISVIALLVLGFMLERGINWFLYTLQDNIRSSGPMRTPLWIFTLILVIGLALYAIDTIFYIVHKFILLVDDKSNLDFDD